MSVCARVRACSFVCLCRFSFVPGCFRSGTRVSVSVSITHADTESCLHVCKCVCVYVTAGSPVWSKPPDTLGFCGADSADRGHRYQGVCFKFSCFSRTFFSFCLVFAF